MTNLGDGTVSTIDTQLGRAVYAIPVGATPDGIALTPDGRFAYVVNSGGGMQGSVSVIATDSNTPIATIPVPGAFRPSAVAITPDGAFAYVADSIGNRARLYVIATATNEVVKEIDATSISAIAMAPNGAAAYATHDFGDGTVLVIDLARGAVSNTIDTGGLPEGVAISPDGAVAFIANGNVPGQVTVVDTATNSVSAQIPVADRPWGVAITPNGASLYVTHGYPGGTTLSVLDAATLTVSKQISVGSTPHGVAITPDGRFAYVANSGWDSVSVVDTSANEVTATIGVGFNPMRVAVAPAPNGCAVPVATPPGAPAPTPTPIPTLTGQEQLRCALPVRRQLSAAQSDVYTMVVTSAGAARLAVTNTELSSIRLEVRRSSGEVVASVSGRMLDATLLPGAYTLHVSAPEAESAAPYTVTWVSEPSSIYVSVPQASEVSVIDPARDVVAHHVRLPVGPYAIAMSPDGKRAYVGSYVSPTLSVVDTATASVVDTITLDAPAQALAITPDELRVYAADQNMQTVSVIDLPTKSIAAKVGVGSGAVDLDVNPSGSRVYAYTADGISVIDTATNAVAATIPLSNGCPVGPSALAIAPDGTHVYATSCGAETLSTIDAATDTIVSTVRLHTTLEDVAVTPDGTRAYVRQGDAPLLVVVDLDRSLVVGEVPYDFAANGEVAIAPDGAFAYVTVSDGTLAIVDTSTNRVATKVALPARDPGRIVVTPPDCGMTNDACVNATRITTFPAAATAMTMAATADAIDPVPSCAAEGRNHTVWYRFTAPGAGTVTVQTSGSTYETVASVYSGSCDALVPVIGGCARDPRDEQPLSFKAVRGTSYYLMLSTPADQGGDLAIQLRFTPRPPISFDRRQVIDAAPAPQRLVLVDVNGDGRPDLVLPGQILLNDGAGRFDERNPISFPPGNLASSFAVADLNRDGKQDIAVVNPEQFEARSTLTVYWGDGTGAVGAGQQYPLGQQINDLAVADFDSDGTPDIAVLSADHVYVLRGLGGGRFSAFQEPGIDIGEAFGSRIATAFLNGDELPDLVVVHTFVGTVSVLLGNGDGSFRPARQYQGGELPGGLAIADLNDDSFPDIAVVNTGEAHGANISVLFGSRDYPLDPDVRISAGFDSPYSDIVAADLDGDGKVDLAATATRGNAVTVLRNDATDVFSQHGFAVDASVRGLVLGDGPTAIRAADLDGDGDPDLVVVSSAGISVFSNTTGQPVPCAGDCSGDGVVTINELITMVNIALQSASLSQCPAGDADGNGQITIDEIIASVRFALDSCPSA